MPDSEVKAFETYFRSFWREATQFCFSNSSPRLYHSTCFLPDLESHVVLFPVAAITSYHGLHDLKQQKYILSWFWRPELQNQGVSRPASLQSLYGKVPPCFFQLLWSPVFLPRDSIPLMSFSVFTWPPLPLGVLSPAVSSKDACCWI